MDKKKILIVCRAFYPENTPRAFRATELSKELARQGHKVTILLAGKTNIHEAFEQEYNLEIQDMGITHWKNPQFGNSGFGQIANRAISRLLSLSIEYPGIELMYKVFKALKNKEGFDLLISIAVPYSIHWGVAKARNKQHVIAEKWVADCGDPYMGCTTDSFKKWFYWEWVEKWFMRKADYVSIPVESARSAYYPEFHDKIKIIPQGFKFENTDYSEYFKGHDVPHFIYAGGFIPGIRDPRPFLDYLCTVDTDFRFLIYTNNRSLVVAYQSKLGNKLFISEYISREALLQELAKMDFVLNFDNNTHTALPSKLIDYAICGRPVLNITKDLDIENINRFLKADYSNKMILPDIENYRIENVSQAFIDLSNAK